MDMDEVSAPRVGIFMPAYRVGDRAAHVLSLIPEEVKWRLAAILVFDNASDDDTAASLLAAAPGFPPGLELYRNEKNYSLGGSTLLAFRRALELRLDYLICLHGDGQADPADLSLFLAAIDEAPYDFILGSRWRDPARSAGYSRVRFWGNRFFSWLQRVALGAEGEDLGAFLGFRMQTVAALPFRRLPLDMAYQPHLILLAARYLGRRPRTKEFAVSWGAAEVSSVNPWRYGLSHLARLLRIKLGCSLAAEDLSQPLRTTLLFPAKKVLR